MSLTINDPNLKYDLKICNDFIHIWFNFWINSSKKKFLQFLTKFLVLTCHAISVLKTSVLKTVYFLFRFRLKLISCSRNPESEIQISSETESELAYAHEPEHRMEF